VAVSQNTALDRCLWQRVGRYQANERLDEFRAIRPGEVRTFAWVGMILTGWLKQADRLCSSHGLRPRARLELTQDSLGVCFDGLGCDS
jgi:hypothetical protein